MQIMRLLYAGLLTTLRMLSSSIFFFFNDAATTEIYTLSLHDALPIWGCVEIQVAAASGPNPCQASVRRDRKSTRLNSSHLGISYAVFCLKKKKGNGVAFVLLLLHSADGHHLEQDFDNEQYAGVAHTDR